MFYSLLHIAVSDRSHFKTRTEAKCCHVQSATRYSYCCYGYCISSCFVRTHSRMMLMLRSPRSITSAFRPVRLDASTCHTFHCMALMHVCVLDQNTVRCNHIHACQPWSASLVMLNSLPLMLQIVVLNSLLLVLQMLATGQAV